MHSVDNTIEIALDLIRYIVYYIYGWAGSSSPLGSVDKHRSGVVPRSSLSFTLH